LLLYYTDDSMTEGLKEAKRISCIFKEAKELVPTLQKRFSLLPAVAQNKLECLFLPLFIACKARRPDMDKLHLTGLTKPGPSFQI
jgi:hypothetical protein